MNERQLNHIEGEILNIREKTDSLHGQLEEMSKTAKILQTKLDHIEVRLNWAVNSIVVVVIIGALFLLL